MRTDKQRESWTSIAKKSVELADLIKAHCQKTGERFDAMVVVPRGGYYPASIVSRILGFSSVQLLQASLSEYVRGADDQHRKTLLVGQMPQKRFLAGKNLLVIDEVCDTGRTLSYLNNYLKKSGANIVRAGVLHFKPTKTQTGYKPDWFIESTSKWVVYPWEVYEKQGRSPVIHKAK